jgi:nucleoside phosphorylase/predicted NACHT family NTPase
MSAVEEVLASPAIGIITALPKEYAAVKVLLESQRPIVVRGRGAGRRYLYGEIPASDGGRHSIVLALLPVMGNNSASSRATLLLEHFPSVQSVLMVGIAGGVPNPAVPDEHVRLGDVVVSNQQGVVQYDFVKETLNGSLIELIHRHPPRPPSASMLEGVRLLEAGEIEGERPWIKIIDHALQQLNITRPPEETDVLASSSNPGELIQHPADSERVKGLLRIFSGPIASANNLLKNPLKRDQLRERFGIKAVEMEGSGIADASWNAEVPYLVVRGVCDYCDRNKGDAWQKYAAIVAAGYTRALLESMPARQPLPPGGEGEAASVRRREEAKIEPHDYPEVKPYLPRRVCETKDAGPFSLYLLVKEKIHDLAEVVGRQKRVILLCDAGVGKSTELKRIASLYSKEDSRFHVELVSLNKYIDQSVPELLDPHWEQVPEDRLLVVLDGFDEIESQNRKTAVRRIESFAEAHPRVHILISCRTNFYSRESAQFSGTLLHFDSYTLLDLNDEVINEYLGETLGSRKKAFIEGVEDNQLYDLLRSPFYLTRLVELFRESGHLPQTKAGIFEELVQHSLKFDAEKFRTTDNLSDKRRQIVETLERLALAMETLGRNYLTNDEYQEIVPDVGARELIGYCALWEKRGDEEITWQFAHNNFQEYLAARVLAHQTLSAIKDFISFEPDYPKIIPSWTNTLSFLFSILSSNDPKFFELLKWVERIEPEIIVKSEPDKVPIAVRHSFLKRVFDDYKQKEIVIDHEKFSYRELARFGQSNETVNFLMDEAGAPANTATLINAVSLLRYTSIPYSQKGRAVTLLERLATDADQDAYARHLALFALTDHGFNSREVIDRVVSKARSSDDDHVRLGLYYLILHSKHLEDNIDVFLEGIEHAGGLRRTASEMVTLGEGLDNAKTPRAVKLILLHLRANPGLWSRRTFLEDHVPVIVGNAVAAYPVDPTIFDLVIEILYALSLSYHREEAAVITSFFDLTSTRHKAFLRVFDDRESCQKRQRDWFDLLAMLADEEGLKYFADQYSDSRLNDRDVWSFQNSLGYIRGSALYNSFNKTINEISGNRFVLAPGRDYNAEQRQSRDRNFQLLFDKRAFLDSLVSVFEGENKSDLTVKDIENIFRKGLEHGHKYSTSALQTLREIAEANGEKVTSELAIKCIENGWERFSITEIYEYMEHDKDLALTPAQRSRITDWCEENLRKVDFRSAITVNPSGSWNTNSFATMLWFFQRRLDLQYPEKVMLDMLSYELFDQSGLSGIEYFEERVDAAAMTERILENLEAGISSSYVLKNHLDYCRRHDIQDVVPLAMREVVSPRSDSWGRQAALEVISSFPGAKSNLEQVLPQITDNFKWQVIKQLVEHNSTVCNDTLRDILRHGDDEERLRAAMHLMVVQDMKGLRYYVEHVERTKQYPAGPTEKSPLRKIQSVEALPLLIRLLKLSFDPSIISDEYSFLYNAVLDALNRIALTSHENFQMVRDALIAFIDENKAEVANVKALHFQLSRLEKLFYTNLAQKLSLPDVLAKLSVLH